MPRERFKPHVPEILKIYNKVVFKRGKYPGKLGQTVDQLLDVAGKGTGDDHWEHGGIQQFADGDVAEIVFLTPPDDARTIKLAQSVPNDKKAKSGKNVAFTMWQRYVFLSNLKQAKTTSDLDHQVGEEPDEEEDIAEEEEQTEPRK